MIIKIFLFLVSISFSTNSGYTISQNNSKIIYKSILESTGRGTFDTTLQTGWYYVVDLDNSYKRQIQKSKISYFIDPKPDKPEPKRKIPIFMITYTTSVD